MKISQLYDQLEMYSDGDPPSHALFVLARLLGTPDRLLIIDPPDDVGARFDVADDTATLFTSAARDVGLPLVQTQPGGVAHINVGQHLLDIYSQQHTNLICFPAMGILCGGSFGSDLALPELGDGSDGEDEIESLRLLARLVKGRRLQLYIPRTGSVSSDKVEVMGRLAADVSYIHGLRRTISQAVAENEFWSQSEQITETLLPENRRTSTAVTTHRQNIERLYNAILA